MLRDGGNAFAAMVAAAAAATSDFERHRKPTRGEKILAEMNTAVPWTELCAVIEPHHPKVTSADGRPPVGLERMLRIHCLQRWFGLSDPAVEEALYDSRERVKSTLSTTKKGNEWHSRPRSSAKSSSNVGALNCLTLIAPWVASPFRQRYSGSLAEAVCNPSARGSRFPVGVEAHRCDRAVRRGSPRRSSDVPPRRPRTRPRATEASGPPGQGVVRRCHLARMDPQTGRTTPAARAAAS